MSAATAGHEPAGVTARVEVTGGGVPSDAELAALVVALTPVALTPVAQASTGVEVTRRRDQVPAWARAALLEGVGGRRPTRPSDLSVARGGA